MTNSNPNQQEVKPFYKKWWFWLIMTLVVALIVVLMVRNTLNRHGIEKGQISAEVTYTNLIGVEVTEKLTYHIDNQEYEAFTTSGDSEDTVADLNHYDDLVKEITDKMIRQTEIDKANTASETALQEATEMAEKEAKAQQDAYEAEVASAEQKALEPDDDGTYTLPAGSYTVGIEADIIPGEYTFVLPEYYQQNEMTEIEEAMVTGGFEVLNQSGDIVAEKVLDLTQDSTANTEDGTLPEMYNVVLEEGYTVTLHTDFILDPTFK